MPAPVSMTMNVSVGSAAGIDIGALASRVSERVIARTTSGAAIAVPMEKTSRAVEIRTSRDVVLRMPERDIEVYSAMKGSIGRLLRLAEMMGTFMIATEESKEMARDAGVVINDRELSLVVQKVTEGRGYGGVTAQSLYVEFEEVKGLVIRLGDGMGRFMAVDAETRSVMKAVRSLGVEMQGEVERAIGGVLVLDGESRKVIREMRMLAVSLQGEMERRLGT